MVKTQVCKYLKYRVYYATVGFDTGAAANPIKRLPEVPKRLLDGSGHGEFRIGLGLFLRPLRIIIDQFPEGHMPPTGREIEGAGA